MMRKLAALCAAAMPAFSQQELVKKGEALFLNGPCVMCHTVRGTIARARAGPDLTHVASRKMLAAGTIPNTRGHLAGWILNPQRIKPGVKMPATSWSSADLQALVAYLESLK